ncbi:hypothetical protein F441_20110 [Phytophthora nicotianae CJ01A1]|uniref:GAG-pre-integrase domain-containing protein n=1 Tax=Phytophthora nicotianae CJ01A1 TaxID=1317063 RepID=W2VX57_PHYNI|nr:hypothetical protein F441_20110 [Phytophthora nicotianae CJ01A1]
MAYYTEYADVGGEWELWHAGMGHLNEDSLVKTKQATIGVPTSSRHGAKMLCGGCMKGKQTVERFPSHSPTSTRRPLERVHTDVWWSGVRKIALRSTRTHSALDCRLTEGGTPITVGLLRAHLVYPSAGLATLFGGLDERLVLDSNVFVDLTSSPGSSPRSAARGAPGTVSTIELADPSLDLAGVRASLSALQQSIDQVETLRELRSDHEDLRRELLATQRRAEDLDRQLADAANAASPYVLFCQRKYDLVRHQLESTQTKLTECLDALQERFDNSHELEACRLRNRDLKIRYDEAVSKFQDRISTLEAQLAAASSFGVIVPPDTPRRIADLESQLARSQSDLQVARDRQSALASRLRELATSHRAAQAEVARLEAAIKHKNGRLRTLNDNYERRLRVADTTIATHRAELVRLQDQVSTPNWDLQKASQRVQAVTSQRDQAKAAHIVTQDRVSAARDNIARLEKRISQVEKSQKTRQDLESALAKLQQEKDALAVKRDELLGQLGERFVEVRLNGTRRRRDCPTLRPFSLLRRATSEHALGPSLPPALLVSPRSLDRLQRSPRLALRVRLVRPDPRSKFCLPWQTARGSDSSSSPAGPPGQLP